MKLDDGAGDSEPSERRTFLDAETGREVIQWTQGAGHNHHLYFTSHSVTADNRWLIFLSERDGHPNLHAIDRRHGRVRRISRNRDGVRKSYVYARGGDRGMNKASPCLDAVRNRLFFVRDDRVIRVDLDRPEGGEISLCALPAGWLGAYTHVSPDGKTYCLPYTDARAFGNECTQWEQLHQVPERMETRGLNTRLCCVDGETGHLRIAAELPFWVTHVQFDPAGSGRVLFNREGHCNGRPLPDRIWCMEADGSFRPLAPESDGEWRSHENWSPDGRGIIYHGMRGGRAFVAMRSWEGALLNEMPLEGVECQHATGLPGGRGMALDRKDGMISLLDPGVIPARQVDLCRHDTAYEDQDTHAHPIARPDGGSVVFTSDRSGFCQVYEVAVPEDWRSAPPAP